MDVVWVLHFVLVDGRENWGEPLVAGHHLIGALPQQQIQRESRPQIVYGGMTQTVKFKTPCLQEIGGGIDPRRDVLSDIGNDQAALRRQ